MLFILRTTGVPKGVMITHESLYRFIHSYSDMYSFTKETRMGLKTNYAFDVSVQEIFGWIKEGGSVVVLPEGVEKELKVLLDSIADYGITHLNLVPSLFSVLLEELKLRDKESLRSLKYFFLAGEALPIQLVKDYHTLGLAAKLENLYGPTEATIYSSCYSTINLTEVHASVPIGVPIDNTQIYILDSELNLVPIGVAGELCIAGSGLARGYLNQEELTKEKFIANPFKEGERLYRTGDLARWLPDGNIDFIGRQDDQVKIRGYRIELGEIESALEGLEGVRQSVVISNEDASGNKQLVGYVVLNEGISTAEIQGRLLEKLPSYMVPTLFMEVDSLPLTSNGKIDKGSLPAIDASAYQTDEYVAHRHL